MNEDFLQFIWRYKYFQSDQLRTVHGDEVILLNHGFFNNQGGPDFLNGKVQINRQLWVGHIELHLQSSDWYRHNHQNDETYQSVILHVVYEHDQDVYYPDGTIIPEVELKGRFDEMLYWRYEQLIAQQGGFPCASMLVHIDDSIKQMALEASLVDRLEEKAIQIARIHSLCEGDFEQLSFVWIARSFGLPNNTAGFEKMAKTLSWNKLKRWSQDPSDAEALMLGVAGLLNRPCTHEYEFLLSDKYKYFKRVHHLEEVEPVWWSLGHCRPQSFPTLRIAQLAHWSFNIHRWVAEVKLGDDLIARLRDVELPLYWKTHYRIGLQSSEHSTSPGTNFLQVLVLNSWLPLRYYYASLIDDRDGVEAVLNAFGKVQAENNKVVREFSKFGWIPKNGGESQALISLYKSRCSLKKCLSCAIGNTIIHHSP